MFKLAVFVSGRGSNLRAVIDRFNANLSDIEVAAVVSNSADCLALSVARMHGIKKILVSVDKRDGFLTYDELIEELVGLEINLIVLAGFLKKIPDRFVDFFSDRIINIHPALLPSFGGKGMYGMHVHEAVFESSAQVSGATVHFVDKIYDNGRIIAQRCVEINGVESPQEIAEKVIKIEHELLPFVIEKFAEGKIHKRNSRIYISD